MNRDEQYEQIKAEFEELLKDLDEPKAKKAVLAACMLSEGMEMTFELFDDPAQALSAIFSAVTKVGKLYGVEFHALNMRSEKLH